MENTNKVMARLDESLSIEILDRLVRGKPLDGLPLDAKDGGLDLGGLTLLEPRPKRTFEFRGVPVTEIEPVVTFERVQSGGISILAAASWHVCGFLKLN